MDSSYQSPGKEGQDIQKFSIKEADQEMAQIERENMQIDEPSLKFMANSNE